LEYSNGKAYVQEVILLGNRRTSDADIMDRAAGFVKGLGEPVAIANLLMGGDEDQLLRAMNVHFPAARSPVPGLTFERVALGLPREDAVIADVFYFRKRVTVTIRRGRTVSRRQLAGTGDARELAVNNMGARVIGFAGTEVVSPQVRLFLETRALPSVEQATQMTKTLAQSLSTPIFVVIKTDSNFSECGGPSHNAFDPFEKDVMTPLRESTYLACIGAGERSRCRLDTPDSPDRRRSLEF
jgi:hypothetical protein